MPREIFFRRGTPSFIQYTSFTIFDVSRGREAPTPWGRGLEKVCVFSWKEGKTLKPVPFNRKARNAL